MEKFNPGDRVVRIQATAERNVDIGETGTFLGYDENWILKGAYAAKVRWDNEVEDGHSCGDLCEYGYGWEVPEQDLERCASIQIDEADYDTSGINSMIEAMFGGGFDGSN